MKIKLLLAMVVLSFLKAHTSQGQCPVVSYKIVDVSKDDYWNHQSIEFNKGLKILMKDTLKPYTFIIKYMSSDNKILSIGRAKSQMGQDDYAWNWHNTTQDSILQTFFEFKNLKYGQIPLDAAWLAKASYISVNIGQTPYFNKWQYHIDEILCSLKLDLKLNGVTDATELASNVYFNKNEIIINLKEENTQTLKASLVNSLGIGKEIDVTPEGSGTYIIRHALTPGIYWLRLTRDDDKSVVKKILVE